VIAMLAPIATQVIQMAISRTREYDADEDGARLTRDPIALASALNKLERGVSLYPMNPDDRSTQAASAMMIANPFGSLQNVMSTHPPMDQRIARLQQMAREMGQY
jgi:protease htpX homolog